MENHHVPSQDNVKFAIASAFEDKIIGRIKSLREKAKINEAVYYQGPIRGLDNDIRLSIPIENTLRVEVHLMSRMMIGAPYARIIGCLY